MAVNLHLVPSLRMCENTLQEILEIQTNYVSFHILDSAHKCSTDIVLPVVFQITRFILLNTRTT